MVHSQDDQRFLYESELSSPELVLVDPELARRARARLPNPGEKEALARIAAQLERTHLPPRAAEAGGAVRRPAARRRHGRWAAPVAVAVSLAAILVLTDVRVEIGKTLASADSSTPAEQTPVEEPARPAPTPAATPTPDPAPAPATAPTRRPARQPGVEPQRFAWAPASGAGGYHVELFRGNAKIFAADTKQAAITIPARWTFAGRNRVLAPGDYRWYVWPVTAGRRAGEAIVQARLTVPAR